MELGQQEGIIIRGKGRVISLATVDTAVDMHSPDSMGTQMMDMATTRPYKQARNVSQ
jgi:hypothetical protein